MAPYCFFLLLFLATLLQYFVTSGSSPGYVVDAMRDVCKAPVTSTINLTCGYCHVDQSPRSKHCHDCDRCVLQFDHHCVWIGTCIGQNSHCKFRWYVCGETDLCIWTLVMYIDYLDNITKPWWRYAIIILLLAILAIFLTFLMLLLLFHSYLIMTNQTTYEFVRRRRISYLRNIPERVHPF